MTETRFPATIHMIDDDFYKTFSLEEGAKLGEGASGSVVQVTRTEEPDLRMAVKLFDQSNLDEEDKLRWFRLEVGIMQNVAHPHVVKCVLAVKTPTPSQFYLCMRLYEKGSLASVFQSLTAQQVDLILVQIASALSYLHSQRIMHGDVKLGNILLDDNGNAALGDFGLSHYISEQSPKVPAYAATATEGYEAPEILNVLSTDAQVDVFKARRLLALSQELGNIASHKADSNLVVAQLHSLMILSLGETDAFALGVSLWQMLFHLQPYSGASYLEMAREAQMPKFFRDCLECLLQPDPDKRGSMPELLEILRRDSTHKDYLQQLEQLYPL